MERKVKKCVQTRWDGWSKVPAVMGDERATARMKGGLSRKVVRAAMLFDLKTEAMKKRKEEQRLNTELLFERDQDGEDQD